MEYGCAPPHVEFDVGDIAEGSSHAKSCLPKVAGVQHWHQVIVVLPLTLAVAVGTNLYL